jgi:hypothetical protein
MAFVPFGVFMILFYRDKRKLSVSRGFRPSASLAMSSLDRGKSTWSAALQKQCPAIMWWGGVSITGIEI